MSDSIGRELAIRSPIRKNCATCRLGYNILAMVHKELINGAPYLDIYRTLVDMEHEGIIKHAPSRASLMNHAKVHLNMRDKAIRANMEYRAQKMNKDIENGVQSILTDIAVAETVVKIGMQDLVDGKIKLDAKDLLAANKQVHEFTKDEEGSLDAATAYVQLGLIQQAIREIVPEDMWKLITTRMYELSTEEEYVEDAEVLDEEDSIYD